MSPPPRPTGGAPAGAPCAGAAGTTAAGTTAPGTTAAGTTAPGTTAPGLTVADITVAGADAAAWSAVDPLGAARPMTWGSPRPVVVMAPHPDDEVLGVGAVLARLQAAGFPVTVVAVTDGEGARPGASAAQQRALAGERAGERRRAFDALGLAGASVRRLCLPDRGLAAHVGPLADAMAGLLAAGPEPALCLATWRGDGHPDHEAVGVAAARACAATGSTLVEYPVWAWHWLRPDDPHFPWRRLRTVRLELGEQVRKGRAIGAFVSQLAPSGPSGTPVLPPDMVARFRRPIEAVLV